MANLDHRQHFRSLDGIRGVAILLVFFFHIYPGSGRDPVNFIASAGWLGVDLFFVLSGFLITGILFDTQHQPHYFRNFYARRALRLFPIYTAVVLAALAVNHISGGRLTIWAAPFFLYAANIIRDAGKNIGFTDAVRVSHLWSLALEEQFYLLWPLALLLARTRRRILLTCLIGSIVSFVLRWVVTTHIAPIPGTPYYELPMRLDSLLCGGSLAILLRSTEKAKWLSAGRVNITALIGGVLLASAVWMAHSGDPFSVPMVRIGYFGAALLFSATIAVAIRPGTWVHAVGNNGLLRLLGRYSYGLYLIHFLPSAELSQVYNELRTSVSGNARSSLLGHVAGIAVFVAYFFVALGVAMLSYHAIELPFLKRKRYFAYADEQASHHLQPEQDTILPIDAADTLTSN